MLLRTATLIASFIMILSLFCPLTATGQVVENWHKQASGFWGVGVVTDANSNVYVTGATLQDAAHNYKEDIVLIKYSANGNVVWLREFDEKADATFGSDIPAGILLDPFGNVIVAGWSFLNGEGQRYVVLKYDPQGNLLWRTRSVLGNQAVRAGCDAKGNIYVTGYSASNSADFVTIKVDPQGNLLWTRTYNGPSNFRDQARALAVHADGDVVVTGESAGGISGYDFATIYYTTDGTVKWTRRFAGSGADAPWDIAFGPNKEVYAGGYSVIGTNTDFALIQYDLNGNQNWVRFWNGIPKMGDSIKRLRVDSSGNIIVTGYEQQSNFYSDFATLKYDPHGNLLWVSRFNLTGQGDEIPWNLAIDSQNNIFVTGECANKMATVKYSPIGAKLWHTVFDNAVTLWDRGYAVAVDAANRVIVTGQDPILTIQYSQGTVSNQPPVAVSSANPTTGTVPLSVAFSSVGSHDTDGSIQSFSWNFGDLTTSSLPNPIHNYTTAGAYTATLTVTDDKGATGKDTLLISVKPSVPLTIHVHSQNVFRVSITGNRWRADNNPIVITDQNNQPISGVSVTARFTGPTIGTVTGVTDINGKVILRSSPKTNPRGEWCFEVTDVRKTGLPYNRSANLVTKMCESGKVF